ncbi:hypothetical protein LV84_02819 [Algoriphagus ratkowskyi]|uniref:Uncharacterized protein n=1 Tax=Algoriphagus ratkowskyi TaxID=57028 RepID=A0A2W7R689_9BACT|nr:hypothetical protein [Algoriphagus ratkowskyi]PZX54666.1 hypothetical protein LV84_02819 [Algoriphagus ratkowskyi]TXD76978.1 hypothetical protein ESW18_14315 [Algoriphagus ratkowskyi]
MDQVQEPNIDFVQNVEKGKRVSVDYEKNLAELSLVFGEVLKDPQALNELFSFSKIDGNSGSIKYNLKKLFEKGENPTSRKKSAIVDAFKRLTNEKARLTNSSPTYLIDFIENNNISVTAPYLAEDFKMDEINELTVSWWTEEFERENLEKDVNWTGKTRAVKLKFDSLVFPSIDETLEANYFLVDDEWAMVNPTVVLGNFDEPTSNEIEDGQDKVSNNMRLNGAPVQLCDVNGKSSQNLIVKIPAIRLEENIASWPKDNHIYLWVGTSGSVTQGTNGTPNISADVNMPIGGLKITRKEANIQRWKSTETPFIISNWNPDADNMYLVWGYVKSNVNIDVTGSIKATKDGVSTELSVKIAKKEEIQLISALSFDKCFTLYNNVNGLDQGYGYYGDTSYPKYPFGKIRAYFTLETL